MRNLNVSEYYTVSLEQRLESLALESNVVINLINHFNDVIPDLAVQFSNSIEVLKNNFFEKTNNKDLLNVYQKSKKISTIANFVNYRDTLVSIPEGFVGNYKNYLMLLIELNSVIYKETIDFVSEYNALLSNIITNKDARMCNTTHSTFVNKIKEERALYISKLEPFFNAKKDISKAKLSTVMDKFGDIDDIYSLANKLYGLHTDDNIRQIYDLVKNSVDYLNIIKKNLNDNSITEICGVAATTVAEGAYYLAQYIEFIAIFRFRCEQALSSTKNMFEVISKLK